MAPKFSLQPVLDYRHTRVEMLEVELGRLHQAKLHGEEFLEALHNRRQLIFEELGQKQQQGEMDLLTISQLRGNLKTVGERIVRQKEHLQELSVLIRDKQNEVISAKQDEEALTTLKTHEVERYQVEQAEQEKRLQDDIYISQAYRRASGSSGY